MDIRYSKTYMAIGVARTFAAWVHFIFYFTLFLPQKSTFLVIIRNIPAILLN